MRVRIILPMNSFAATLADLRRHRIGEVFEGRGSKALEPNLRRLRGQEQVKEVRMDMSLPFRSIAQLLFPKAKIVDFM